jgi:DNA repair ATPase RecN
MDSSDERLAALRGKRSTGRHLVRARQATQRARSKAARRCKRDVGKVLAQLAMGSCSFQRCPHTPRSKSRTPSGPRKSTF